MMTMKRLISIIICISLTLTLCSCGRGLKRFEKSFIDVFDTASNIVAYDSDQSAFDAKYDEFHALLVNYNNLFDIYESHDGVTSLKDVNDEAAEFPVKVDGATIELLLYGKDIYEKTDGAVNICMGAVLSIWHEYREEGKRVPKMSELKKAAEHCDIDDLIIDEEKSTVYFADSELKLDVGAIAKGYAAQKAKEYAQEKLWESALINLGGNITTYGAKPDGSQWNIQIENPRGGDAIDTMQITDESVVTSGDYQRYYEVNGVRYCHIIDPDTLMPAENYASVTVICEDSALADALSTALFILPPDEGKKLTSRLKVKAVRVDKKGAVTRV